MRYLDMKCLLHCALVLVLAGCSKEEAIWIKSKPQSSEIQRIATSSANSVATVAVAPEVIELKRCTRKSDGAVVSTASLSLLPNGDMVFSGAVDAGKNAELARINFAEMSMRTVSASATTSRGNTLSASTSDNRTMAYYATRHGYFVYTSSSVSYSCEPFTSASLLSTSARPLDL